MNKWQDAVFVEPCTWLWREDWRVSWKSCVIPRDPLALATTISLVSDCFLIVLDIALILLFQKLQISRIPLSRKGNA